MAETTTDLHHALIQPLDQDDAAAVWQWVTAGGTRPDGLPTDLSWLHATLDDGLIWGGFRDGGWATGHGYGSLVPDLRRHALWELRLFGPSAEVLIWPLDESAGSDGPLIGRVLGDADSAPTFEADRGSYEYSRMPRSTDPVDRRQLLFGDRRVVHEANGNGFTLVGDNTGATQVVPLDLADELFDDRHRWWPANLLIRQYLQSDPATNALRVGATRFADVGSTHPPQDAR